MLHRRRCRVGCWLHEPAVPGCTDTRFASGLGLCSCRTVTQRAYGELLCFRALWAHVSTTGTLTAVLRSAQLGCCRPLRLHAACVVVVLLAAAAPCRAGSANMWDQGALQLRAGGGLGRRVPRAAAAASGRWLPRHAGLSGQPAVHLACSHVRPGASFPTA